MTEPQAQLRFPAERVGWVPLPARWRDALSRSIVILNSSW
jgi:hypothetical protein